MYPKIMSDIKIGLLPITILVRNDLAIDNGQLTAKQSRNKTSQMLKCGMLLVFLGGLIIVDKTLVFTELPID